jgi:hypothetical protein
MLRREADVDGAELASSRALDRRKEVMILAIVAARLR